MWFAKNKHIQHKERKSQWNKYKVYYAGLNIHKKIIAFCIKLAAGTTVAEGKIDASRKALKQWAESTPGPWIGAIEATRFTDWVYDFLKPYAQQLQVGNPLMMKAITAANKKNDKGATVSQSVVDYRVAHAGSFFAGGG